MPEILVVDDSKVMRDMITACLRPDPALGVTHAASGLEAIERLSLSAYDVLVLDLNMPDIGGLEVVEFVRGQDKLKTLPILIVTTRGDEASKAAIMSAGANRFLTKPFTPDTILAEVRALLGTGELTVQVDLQEFRDAYLAEVDEHLADANACLVEAERAAREGRACPRELRDLMRLLHTIKGLSAMVGIEPIVDLAHRMETVVRAADRVGGMLSERTFEALAEGTRELEARVRAVANGTAISDAPVAALDEVDEPDTSARVTPVPGSLLDPEIEARLNASEREQLAQAAPAGLTVLSIEFGPSPEKAAQGLTITSVRERAKPLGDTVKVVPLSRPASPAAPSGLLFVVLLTTRETESVVAAAIGIPATDVHVVATSATVVVVAAPAHRDVDDAIEHRPGVLRVDVTRVDDALEKLSALLVTRSRLGHAAATLEGVGAREIQAILVDNARQLRDLRGAILRLRMVPVVQVLDRLPLVVRGLARTTGKDARLVVHGEGAELDKTVAERLFPAIVHLIRNAIDHGLETPEERTRLGKTPFGTISITCVAESNRRLDLRIEDDGRGVDRAKVASKAGREASLDDAALLDLLCRPGFSTRDVVDTTSGRGVGMDIVKKILDSLGGELLLETTPGRGTTFVLRVPLTIAIVDAFTVRCGEERYVVPVSVVEEIIEVDPKSIVRGPGTRMIPRRGEPIAIIGLEEVLARSGTRNDQSRFALVVRRGHGQGEAIAFTIDRVLGQQETVVRPLGDPLVATVGVSGTADLGDGRATLVLDLLAVAARLEGRAA